MVTEGANMEETSNNLFAKKNIITLLMICIILLIIPVGVKLVQEQQQLRSRAGAVEKITFTGPNVDTSENTTTSPEVDVELRAPWPPITQAP